MFRAFKTTLFLYLIPAFFCAINGQEKTANNKWGGQILISNQIHYPFFNIDSLLDQGKSPYTYSPNLSVSISREIRNGINPTSVFVGLGVQQLLSEPVRQATTKRTDVGPYYITGYKWSREVYIVGGLKKYTSLRNIRLMYIVSAEWHKRLEKISHQLDYQDVSRLFLNLSIGYPINWKILEAVSASVKYGRLGHKFFYGLDVYMKI